MPLTTRHRRKLTIPDQNQMLVVKPFIIIAHVPDRCGHPFRLFQSVTRSISRQINNLRYYLRDFTIPDGVQIVFLIGQMEPKSPVSAHMGNKIPESHWLGRG